MSLKTLQILSRNRAVASIAIAGFVLWAIGSPAIAALIGPGQTAPTTGTAVVPPAPFTVFTTGPQAFVAKDIANNISFTGLLDTTVYTDPGNPLGGLDFVYQFSNDPNPNNDNILHFAATSFSGYLTDADFVAGSGTPGNFPSTVQRDAFGDTIDFDFPLADAVVPGATSVLLVIKTNAPTFVMGNASLQDGGNVSITAPAPAAVPEPTTAAIAGFALCAMGLRRRKVH